MIVTSNAFADGGPIPARYTCDADDVSPPLAWSGAPDGTEAFAIVVDDPDAGGWVHWILADIPSATAALAEGAAAGVEGTTDFGRRGWGGPCPPSGSHRYVFEVFALSDALDLEPGFDADALRAAIDGKVLASGRLTGTYRRGG
jgi:Raf kinase inhibitor-like YbhB/YbcL family protein